MNLAIVHEKDDDISSIVPALVPAVGNLHPVSRRTRTLTRNSSYISTVDRRPPSSIDGCVTHTISYFTIFLSPCHFLVVSGN